MSTLKSQTIIMASATVIGVALVLLTPPAERPFNGAWLAAVGIVCVAGWLASKVGERR